MFVPFCAFGSFDVKWASQWLKMRITSLWYVDALILLLISAILFVKYVSRRHGYWKEKNIFYVKPIPLFGNFYDIVLSKHTIGEYLANLYKKTTDPFFGIYVFGTPHLILRSPEIIKQVMVKDFACFDDRTIFAGDHDVLGKNMLFLMKNPEWKTLRSKLTTVFSPVKLKGLVPLMNGIGESMKQHIEDVAVPRHQVEVKEICAKYTTAVIARCAFGIHARCFEDEDCPFRLAGKLIFDFDLSTAIQQTSAFFLPTLSRIFRMKLFKERVYSFLREVFWQVINERETKNIRGNDLLELIIDLRRNEDFRKAFEFDGDKMVAQAAMFFSAGFETSSSTMAFALYELCLQPQIQSRLREELHQTLARDGEFTYDNIQQMKYLHMVVSETLRKYPVLPFLDRRCNTDYKVPGTDFVIEKGTPVYIPLFGLHYDPRFFQEPQKFDPERFSEERIADIVPFSYLPFGEGQRNCIGGRFGLLSTKIGLARILSDFEVTRTKETPVPLEFEPRTFVLASKVGLPMKVEKIQKTY